MNEFLSIVTPVLNGARFVETNLKSIASLKFPHEHIIVDGGSTDGTLDIVSKYPSVIVVTQAERNGMYGAIRQGFCEAKGTLLTWINCDDFIEPFEYDKMVHKMIEEKADFVYSNAYFDYLKDGKKELIKASLFPKFFLKRGMFPFVQPTTIYTSKLYQSIGGMNVNFKIAGDLDLFYRMAICKSAKFTKYRGATVHFLKYGESLGDKNKEKYRDEKKNIPIMANSIFSRLLLKLTKI